MTPHLFRRGIILALCLLIAAGPLFVRAEDFREALAPMDYEEMTEKYRYDEY